MIGDNVEFIRPETDLQSRPALITRGDVTRRCPHAIAAMLFVILAQSSALAGSDGLATVSSINPAQLEAFVDEMVRAAMRQDDIAGVSVAIVDRSGPLVIKSYGMAEPGRPVDADTRFQLQSISKTLVWVALTQLVERGKIQLDDPLNEHLRPSLQIPDEGFRRLGFELYPRDGGFYGAVTTVPLDSIREGGLLSYPVSLRRPP
jgi:CubicO group peptidase (beta-lactamase class C family)